MENSTALTVFTDHIGLTYLTSLYEAVYSSGIFHLIMSLVSISCVVAAGFSLHEGKFPSSIFKLAAVMILTTPFKGQPVGFLVVDNVARISANILRMGTTRFSANHNSKTNATNMPPGIVIEMVAAAASQNVKDPELRNQFAKFVGRCLPDTMRIDGQKASIDDLFNFEYSKSFSALSNATYSIQENVLDISSLEENKAIRKNCFEQLKRIRIGFIEQTDPENFGWIEDKENEEWRKNWLKQKSPFINTVTNMSIALSSQYAGNDLAKSSSMGEWRGTPSNLAEGFSDLGTVASMSHAWASIADVGSWATGSRWAASTGAALKDLRENLELIPYALPTVKNILRILAIFAIFTVVTGSLNFFMLWAGAWIAVTIAPAVIEGMRAVSNSTLLAQLGIQNLVNNGSGTSALAYKVDVSLAKQLLIDFYPLAYATIQTEMKTITLLSGSLLGLGWVGGMVGNGIVGSMISRIKSSMVYKLDKIPSTIGDSAAAFKSGLTPAPPPSPLSKVGGHGVGYTFQSSNPTSVPIPPSKPTQPSTWSEGQSFSSIYGTVKPKMNKEKE